jgi:hypothetical protein
MLRGIRAVNIRDFPKAGGEVTPLRQNPATCDPCHYDFNGLQHVGTNIRFDFKKGKQKRLKQNFNISLLFYVLFIFFSYQGSEWLSLDFVTHSDIKHCVYLQGLA